MPEEKRKQLKNGLEKSNSIQIKEDKLINMKQAGLLHFISNGPVLI